jgi:hypothetical protein
MPRQKGLQSHLSPLVDELTQKLAAVIEKFTTERIAKELKGQRRGTVAARRAGRPRRARALCYFPGCKNTAAPRFGMFCAAEHKNLSKADKEKYRAKHLKKAA